MQTISFYSYKGGTGRTLVVANVARYLARFRQKVFVVDLDLEAPGLHYKLGIGREGRGGDVGPGVVDYVREFFKLGRGPRSLKPFVRTIKAREKGHAQIWLMPAGNAPSREYSRRLAEIDWHGLFYGRKGEGSAGAIPRGVPLFMELKATIEKKYSPDFLLVDSRTGITEVGGVATSVLPDRLVCLLLHNKENREGVREVLRSVQVSERLPGQVPIEVVVVVTRIPEREDRDAEDKIVAEVKDYLCEHAEDLAATLAIPEVFVLHSEPELELSESLRIGGDKTPEESVLLRDYLRLFTKLIPAKVIGPHIAHLLSEIRSRVWDDPKGVERDLKELANSYPSPDVLGDLIKLQRLRRADANVLLETAHRFWQLSGREETPLLWEVVRDNFQKTLTSEDRPFPLEFVEAVWLASGSSDEEFVLRLAASYSSRDMDAKAADLLLGVLKSKAHSEEVVIRCLRYLRSAERWSDAFRVIDSYEPILGTNAEFQAEWAEILVAKRDRVAATTAVGTGRLQPDALKEHHFPAQARLLELLGRREELEAALEREFAKRVGAGPSRGLAQLGRLYSELGRQDDFKSKLEESLGRDEAREFLEYLGPRYGLGGRTRRSSGSA